MVYFLRLLHDIICLTFVVFAGERQGALMVVVGMIALTLICCVSTISTRANDSCLDPLGVFLLDGSAEVLSVEGFRKFLEQGGPQPRSHRVLLGHMLLLDRAQVFEVHRLALLQLAAAVAGRLVG